MLPDAPEKVVQELKRSKPPVAYIQELRKRADVLGWAEASKEMKELMKRAGKVINLNKKKARRKKVGPSLVGKSPRRKAAMMEARATQSENRAGKLIENAEKERVRAESWRKKAAAERYKAKAQEEKIKGKKQ